MAECVVGQREGGERVLEAGEPRETRVELLRELSRQLSLEDGDPVSMELEFLQNVYLDELEVEQSG